MEEVQIDRAKFRNITETLEQVTSIARAAKFGLATEYAKGLSDEEIANVFSGIVELIEPVKDIHYTINEGIRVGEEKVVIK